MSGLAGIGSLVGLYMASAGCHLNLLGRSGRSDSHLISAMISGQFLAGSLTLTRCDVSVSEEASAAAGRSSNGAKQSMIHSGMYI